MPRYSKTERVGVNAVEKIVLDEFGWIFREQPIADVGIDAHIELVEDGNPTGKLVAVQIKTGASHFKDRRDAIVYYGSISHLEYWTGHSLPVILVAHLPDSNQTLWVLIHESTVVNTQSRWKIEIPKTNIFGGPSKNEISKIFEGPPSLQKLRKLAIDEPLMRHIKKGGKVSVELEHWYNKSLGRTPVMVFIHDEDGNEILSQEWFQYYKRLGIKELAETLFPWSSAKVDEEFYEMNADGDDDWSNSLERAIDEDNGYFWEEDEDSVYPYTDSSGEVEYYRLELILNDLGKSFLEIADYLSEDS